MQDDRAFVLEHLGDAVGLDGKVLDTQIAQALYRGLVGLALESNDQVGFE